MLLESLERLYDGYVDGFREVGGELPEMMRLKREHTANVVRYARAIADGESFDARTRTAACAGALLHDTGRYEQLRRYNTFRDSESIDHAELSHRIVCEQGWLDGGEIDGALREAILSSVLYHSRREIPDSLGALAAAALNTVRDADKLDIFRILEERVQTTDWRTDSRAFWNLDIAAAPNPEVVASIDTCRSVDYRHVRSLADFVLIQIGWLVCGLCFGTSRRLCVEGGHLAFRRDFLHQLTDDTSIDRLCDMAARALESEEGISCRR